jgi:hypothetical protein
MHSTRGDFLPPPYLFLRLVIPRFLSPEVGKCAQSGERMRSVETLFDGGGGLEIWSNLAANPPRLQGRSVRLLASF